MMCPKCGHDLILIDKVISGHGNDGSSYYDLEYACENVDCNYIEEHENVIWS